MKVLHGPVNVGNQPWTLSNQERLCGIESTLVVNYNTWLGYSHDSCLSPLSNRNPVHALRRLAFGLSAPFRYDVLHYYFGLSYLCWNDYGSRNPLWFADLKIAKRLGRKIFMTLQGCDARISTLSASRNTISACTIGHCQAAPVCRASLDTQRYYLIEKVLPYCDRVFILNPELGHYVPNAAFLPYANIDIEAVVPSWPKTSGPAVIVHAPSDPSIKGSQYIVNAIRKLQQHFSIEFIEVKGLPHTEALEIYWKADFVIDQTLTGWYGGFAVEAMAMGKPVACYLRQDDFQFIPPQMAEQLPMLPISPATMERDLAAILIQRESWAAWGKQSRDFVMRWHNPARIACAMVAAYRDPASSFDLEIFDETAFSASHDPLPT